MVICSKIFISSITVTVVYITFPGEWEAQMYVPLLFSTCFPGDMCYLLIPCGFQTQLVLPSPYYFYLLKNNIQLNKTIWKKICIDKS